MLLFSVGARTPVLALLSLRRRRNLLAVALPYAALVAGAHLLGASLPPPARVGLLALVCAPALLSAPRLASALGARSESAGALVAGTTVVSLVLAFAVVSGAAPAALATVQTAALAFVGGLTFASALPTLRDLVLGVLVRAADVAAIALLALAAVDSGARVDPLVVGAAVAVLAVGIVAASLASWIGGGEPRAAMVGGGTRDFGVAIGLALASGVTGATGVPLAYASALGFLIAVALITARGWRARA